MPVLPLTGNNAGGLSGESFTATNGSVFSRLSNPVGEAFASGSGDDLAFWNGFRVLSSTEVRNLATAIVRLIRERGEPFFSLGDFVNRSLSSGSEGEMGILQRAIEESGINASLPGFSIEAGQAFPSDINASLLDGKSQASGFPGYLTQADILQALAPILAARSDTFVIRAYGDAVNPIGERVQGRAWCEAIVQRLPRDTIDEQDPLARDAQRRFKIVSFRWLNQNEI